VGSSKPTVASEHREKEPGGTERAAAVKPIHTRDSYVLAVCYENLPRTHRGKGSGGLEQELYEEKRFGGTPPVEALPRAADRWIKRRMLLLNGGWLSLLEGKKKGVFPRWFLGRFIE